MPDNVAIVELQRTLDHEYPGIGIEIGRKNGLYYNISSIEGSPAHKAGLKHAEIILEIDGKDAYEYSLLELSSFLRGKAGSEVTIKVMRVGWYNYRTFFVLFPNREIFSFFYPELRLVHSIPFDLSYCKLHRKTYLN